MTSSSLRWPSTPVCNPPRTPAIFVLFSVAAILVLFLLPVIADQRCPDNYDDDDDTGILPKPEVVGHVCRAPCWCVLDGVSAGLGGNIYCEAGGTSVAPSFPPTGSSNSVLVAVNLSSSGVERWPMSASSKTSHPACLERLVLTDNRLVDFRSGGSVRMRRLELAGNDLTSLKRDAFSGLDRLVYLDLSRNRITFLAENVFRDLVRLEVIHQTGSLRSYSCVLSTAECYLSSLYKVTNTYWSILLFAVGYTVRVNKRHLLQSSR